MQRFSKISRMRKPNKRSGVKGFKIRAQRRRTEARKFRSKRAFIRAVFTCLRKGQRKIAHGSMQRSMPLKNILINARTAFTFQKVEKRVSTPVVQLTRTPQEIMFSTFFRRLSAVKIQKVLKTSIHARLYESLRQSLNTEKPVFIKPPTVVAQIETALQGPADWVTIDQWKKMSRQDKYDFHSRIGKFKKNTAVTENPTTALFRITEVHVPDLEPQGRLMQEKNNFKRGDINRAAKIPSTAAQPAVVKRHSKNWIPEDQWKKMPKRARNEFLASTGKLKQKSTNAK